MVPLPTYTVLNELKKSPQLYSHFNQLIYQLKYHYSFPMKGTGAQKSLSRKTNSLKRDPAYEKIVKLM